MKFIFWCLLALGAGIGLMRLSTLGEGGYVKIFVGDYLVEMKFFVFVVSLLIVLLVLYYLLRFISGLLRTPKAVGNWNNQRNLNAAQEKLGAGFLSLMKGDWKKAEKQLIAKTNEKYNKVPFINFLAAAQAAQEQGKYEARDYYLSQAIQASPKNQLAVSMTKARLHQQSGQNEQALATLLSVQKEAKNNSQYQAMLVQAYDDQDDFDGLADALPKARKLGALPDEMLNDIQADVDINTFVKAVDKEAAWKGMSKVSRQDPDFIRVYSEHQLDSNRPDVAEKIIRIALKKNWDDGLVNVYGRIVSTHRKKLLRNAEGWLLARPENAELHLAVGRLAAQDKNPERAQEAFEQAIKISQLPEAYEGLGKLHEENQDLRKALALYRSGLSSTNHSKNTAALLLAKDSSDEDEELNDDKPKVSADAFYDDEQKTISEVEVIESTEGVVEAATDKSS